MIKWISGVLLLPLWLNLSLAATISPWGDATLQVFDILVPNSGGLDLMYDGDVSYLAAEYQGLYILDTSNLDDIKVRYQISPSDFGVPGYSLNAIAKQGNYLFCGFRNTSVTMRGYLKVVNLIDLDSTGPFVESNDVFFNMPSTGIGQVTGLFLDEQAQELYAALRLGGLSLVDVTDPSNPVVKGKFDPGIIEHQEVIVDKSRQRAYVGGWINGIGYVDITDPNPAMWTQNFVDDVTASDRYWYMAQNNQYLYAPIADTLTDNTFDEGLAVYDLTENFADPTKPPVRIGFAPIPAQFQCETAAGGKDEGLVGGDPAPHQIQLQENYAIVANGCMGIAVFDITQPTNPFFVKAYEIPGQADWPWSVAVAGDALITVGRNKNNTVNNDIYVFRITPVTFAFADQVDVPLDSMVSSDIVTINGLGVPTAITIDNGEYSINSDVFTNSPGTINNGDSVQVRLGSSVNYSTQTTATLSIGGVSDTFNATTIADSTINIWPADVDIGDDISVFIFGENFTTDGSTEVYFNGVRQWLVAAVNSNILIVRLTSVDGSLFGPVTVITPVETKTSTRLFGSPGTGLSLTGVWPSAATIDVLNSIFLFGTGFTLDGSTEVYFNGERQWIVAPVTSEMLIVRVTGSATLSGTVTVVTPVGTANSAQPLVFSP